MKAKLTHVKGNEITLLLDDDLDVRSLKRNKGVIEADVEFQDNRFITHAQRSKIYALFGDIQEYTGYDKGFLKKVLVQDFEEQKGIDNFSLATNQSTVSQAGELIEYIIRFCFEYEIPFMDRQYHMDTDSNKILFYYLMNRKCFVCGKDHADIAHVETVGLGRNRKSIDHTQNRLMALCREHHQEQHNLGIKSFMEKYHLVGLKLNQAQLKELGVSK